MAKVCNPIYDTVFKFLIEDKRVAKILLGAILNKTIVDIEIKGHEYAYSSDEDNNLKLLRFDFAGTIENPDGTKETVTIELQKASEPEEVMRFRKYFGIQMANESNADSVIKYRRNKERTPYEVKKPRHIYGIFILGHTLGKGFEYPLIKGSTVFYDEDDNVLNFKTQCEFIKAMTYHLYIIQIPFLPEKPKKPLENILRAFDQRYKLEYDSKYLELTEDKDSDSDFNVIFRRLLSAAGDEQLRRNVDAEDYAKRLYAIRMAEREDLEDELKETNQQLDAKKQQLKEATQQLNAKDQQLNEATQQLNVKEQQLNAKDQQLNAKEQQLNAKDQQLNAKDQQLNKATQQLHEATQQLNTSIKMLSSFGVPSDKIAAQLNISIDYVNKVLDK
jgi:hypothetical protein